MSSDSPKPGLPPCAVCGKPAVSLVFVSDAKVEPRCADHQPPKPS